MTDDELVHRFESCELGNECFHHRDHVRLARLYLLRYGRVEGQKRFAEGIRRFAAHHGKSDKYHETVTVAWLRLVAAAMERAGRQAGFEELTATAPELLDKRTIERFYSSATLDSPAARLAWAEPDLQPLP